MALNNLQWFNERGQAKWVGGKLKVDAFTLLTATVDAMTQRLDPLSVNAVNSSAPPPCEICGSYDHLPINCQLRSPFTKTPVNKSIMSITIRDQLMTLISMPTI